MSVSPNICKKLHSLIGQVTDGIMAQNGFCFDDIYLLAGINLFCHTRAPMWILGDL